MLGISPDPVKKVKKFHENEELNFPLLADEDHAVAEKYGVWVEKSMYGKKYMGIERSTFVIDPEGKVKAEFRKVTYYTTVAAAHATCDALDHLEDHDVNRLQDLHREVGAP